MIPEDAKDHFWSVVKECLVEFHRRPRAWSRTRTNRVRTRVEAMPHEEMELFYHSEPFDVACRLAQHPLDMAKHLSRYLQIRDGEDSRKSEATETGTA
jgi:hypothetical protein